MSDAPYNGLVPEVVVDQNFFNLRLAYADGSEVRLKIPRPENAKHLSHDQLQQLALRIAIRLLSISMDDLTPSIVK